MAAAGGSNLAAGGSNLAEGGSNLAGGGSNLAAGGSNLARQRDAGYESDHKSIISDSQNAVFQPPRAMNTKGSDGLLGVRRIAA